MAERPTLRPGEVPAKFEPGFPVWLNHPKYPSFVAQDKEEHDELLKKDPKKWILSDAHIAQPPYPARVHHKDYPPVLAYSKDERAQWESKGYVQQGSPQAPEEKGKKEKKAKEE
jgi:hypothetical protein